MVGSQQNIRLVLARASSVALILVAAVILGGCLAVVAAYSLDVDHDRNQARIFDGALKRANSMSPAEAKQLVTKYANAEWAERPYLFQTFRCGNTRVNVDYQDINTFDYVEPDHAYTVAKQTGDKVSCADAYVSMWGLFPSGVNTIEQAEEMTAAMIALGAPVRPRPLLTHHSQVIVVGH